MRHGSQFKTLSLFLVVTYLLSACGGALPPSPQGSQNVQPKEAVFTGVVESINGNQWTVSGQTVTVDAQTSLDPNVLVGAVVKVEARVAQDGSVLALKVESSIADNTVDNSNSSNDNTNDNTNGNDDTEVFGVVEAITASSITVAGVVYNLADFTEFKDTIAVGDQVKIEVTLNTDGTFTIRKIEKTDNLSNENSNDANSNNNANFNDNNNDNSDDDHGGNSNSNDDSGDDGGGNGNDD